MKMGLKNVNVQAIINAFFAPKKALVLVYVRCVIMMKDIIKKVMKKEMMALLIVIIMKILAMDIF